MVAYRGAYAARLLVEEVAPSIGWHIATKIDERSKSGFGYALEAPVCGAGHRLPRVKCDKFVKGSSKWFKCEEQTSRPNRTSAWSPSGVKPTPDAPLRGPGRGPFFLFFRDNAASNYTRWRNDTATVTTATDKFHNEQGII